MVSQVMKRYITKETPMQLDIDIKFFLSNLNNVTESLKIKNITWIISYNYQSLFNLSYAVSIFGPLVNFWEGENCGEGYLRHDKLRIRDVHTNN